MGIVGSKGGAGVAERIVSLMPRHSVYIEGFAGLGAVCLRKARAECELLVERQRDRASLLRARAPASVAVVCGDVMRVVAPERVPPDAVVYLDPPYLRSVCRAVGRRYYQHDLVGEAEHRDLLLWVLRFRCRVLISGYWSSLYASLLQGWRLVQFAAGTRGGRAVECVWANFPETADLHDTRFVGEGFRERERVKRKVGRWVRRLGALPLAERAAVLAAFDDTGLHRRK